MRDITDEEQGIIEIYGQIFHSHHDWHDKDFLEGLILAKYNRETAIVALKGLLGRPGSRFEGQESVGEMMETFIQTMADRFIWHDGDVEILSTGVPYADGEMEKGFEAEQEDNI